jgi:hypothetical protein
MNHRDIHIEDGEARASVARGKATSPSSAQPRRGDAQILEFQAHCRRPRGLEDASDPVEGFESIGSLAVRIVGQFELPKLVVMTATGGEAP